MLRTDSEEQYVCILYGYRSVGKQVPILGPLSSDEPACSVPLTEDYEYSGRGSVLIHMTCLVGKCDS